MVSGIVLKSMVLLTLSLLPLVVPMCIKVRAFI